MRILICGASGFIGRHLVKTLTKEGHTVLRGVRNPLKNEDIGMDYRRDTRPEDWLPRLIGVDAVINSVGVLRERKETPMELLHNRAPQALFTACSLSSVSRVVHISALGVGGSLRSRFLDSRVEAEERLRTLSPPLSHLILRPSLIFAEDGASARLFTGLANLALHPLPDTRNALLRPVHIDDIVHATARWLADPHAISASVAAVGREEATLSDLLASYRQQLGHTPAWHIRLPPILMRLAARLGDLIPGSLLCSETLSMLEAGNTADDAAFAHLLGRPPRSFRDFFTTDPHEVPAR